MPEIRVSFIKMDEMPPTAPSRTAAFHAAALQVLACAERLLRHLDCFDEDGVESVPLVAEAARSLVSAFESATEGGTAPEFPPDRNLRHDMGNWLQTIGGFTTLLLMEAGLPGEVRECLETLDAHTRELIALLNA